MAGKKTFTDKLAKTKPQFISQILTGQKTLAAKVALTKP